MPEKDLPYEFELAIPSICVLPEHQGHGLGRLIMQALTEELEQRAPASAYVSLIADGDAHHLYRKFGFEDTAPDSIGMARWVQSLPES